MSNYSEGKTITTDYTCPTIPRHLRLKLHPRLPERPFDRSLIIMIDYIYTCTFSLCTILDNKSGNWFLLNDAQIFRQDRSRDSSEDDCRKLKHVIDEKVKCTMKVTSWKMNEMKWNTPHNKIKAPFDPLEFQDKKKQRDLRWMQALHDHIEHINICYIIFQLDEQCMITLYKMQIAMCLICIVGAQSLRDHSCDMGQLQREMMCSCKIFGGCGRKFWAQVV